VKNLGALMLSCFLKWGLLRIWGFCYNGMPHVENGGKMDGQIGVVAFSKVKGVKKKKKERLKGWLGADSVKGRKWVERTKYRVKI
jgi:hypothetical protein